MSKKNAELLKASEQVLKLAEERRKRMAARTEKTAPAKTAPKVAAKTVKASDELPPPPAEEEKKEEEVAAEEEALPPPAEEEKEEEVAAEEEAPAEEKKEEMPAPPVAASAKKAAKTVKAEAGPNGGFEAALSPAGDRGADAGKDAGLGVHVPPELQKAVDEGQEGSTDDDAFSPGILIPPGLEDAVQAFVDPAIFSSSGEVRFDIVPFAPEGAKTAAEVILAGAHWILCANGDPLAKISLKDQDHAEKIAAHFVSADFGRSVLDGISKHGLPATLSAVKAKPYVAVVDQRKEIATAKAKLAASAEESLRQKVAGLKTRYVDCIGLALVASANNVLLDNPVKDILVAALADLGVPEQVSASLVDDAWFTKGKDYVASLLDKAEEWSNTTPEAFKEIQAMVEGVGKRARPLPSERSPAERNPNYNHALAHKMAAAAIPVTPATDPATVSASLRVSTPEPANLDAKAAFRARYKGFKNLP